MAALLIGYARCSTERKAIPLRDAQDLQWRANRTSWCDSVRGSVGGLDQTRPATLAPVPTTNNRLSLAVDQLPGSCHLPADRGARTGPGRKETPAMTG